MGRIGQRLFESLDSKGLRRLTLAAQMAPFVYKHRVRWRDVDLAGIVHFAHFVAYFEAAEQEWIRSYGIDFGAFLQKLDICMPRVSLHCNYHAPARLDDLLAINVKLGRIGRTSFTLGFDVYRNADREHVAEGHFVITTVSRTSFKPVRVPEELREMLDALRE
jgi:acyl-CoA thioester hydrolase